MPQELPRQAPQDRFESVALIPDAAVRSLVDIDAALHAIEQAYADYGRERRVLSDPPALLMANGADAFAAFKVKGARLASLGVAGFRMIADRDTDTGEETIDYCWVADIATGRLIGLVDETWLHRLRTALTGVVAAKWLARRDSRIAVIIGAGKIAEELPAGLCRAFDLKEVRVVARRAESAAAFAARHGARVPVRPLASVTEAVQGADIIMCISSAAEPVLRAEHLAPGVFVCGMGGGAEIAAGALERADRFVIDDLAYAFTIGSVRGWVEGGMTREAVAGRVDADLGEIAIAAKPGRLRDRDIVLSVVQGMASCDVALSRLVLARAGLMPKA